MDKHNASWFWHGDHRHASTMFDHLDIGSMSIVVFDGIDAQVDDAALIDAAGTMDCDHETRSSRCTG